MEVQKNRGSDPDAYWKEHTTQYLEELGTSYHHHRIRMIRALMRESDHVNLLDFGCGDGLFLEKAASGVGIDINAEMVAAAKNKIGEHPSSNLEFFLGGVEILSAFPPKTFDAVLAANVLAYMKQEECEIFYRESRRLLKPGGALIVSHSNELFDLFTLNAYTVRFFDKYFNVNISRLLTHPDAPDRLPFVTRENPLGYRDKLRHFGFTEVQQEFAIPHRVPPLLDDSFDPDDLQSREIHSTLSMESGTDWRRAFVCSIFGSRSVLSD